MRIHLKTGEREQFAALQAVRDENLHAMALFSHYLIHHPRFITGEEVGELASSCGITPHQAFLTLLAASCGLNVEENPADRRLFHRYFEKNVTQLKQPRFTGDPYYRQVHISPKEMGAWAFRQEKCEAYELFVAGEPVLGGDYRENQPLGYFDAAFHFPAVLQNGNEWMTLMPNEILTSESAVAAAHGHVTTFGLGLGYFAWRAAMKDTVSCVTCVERDASVIALFESEIRPQLPNESKIKIVQADALDYAKDVLPGTKTDFLFADIWRDVSDGLPLYLQFKKLERYSKNIEWCYWVETSMLSNLRWQVFAMLEDAMTADVYMPFPLLEKAKIETVDELTSCLTTDFLRRIAAGEESK